MYFKVFFCLFVCLDGVCVCVCVSVCMCVCVCVFFFGGGGGITETKVCE